MTAIKNRRSDPGARVTLLGLYANVALTGIKGAAGYFLSSASLMADAAHSGSDLLVDVVTLTTYQWSRRDATLSYPYGYGKYEAVGSAVVSILLVGTALGLGFHSYHLLLQTLGAMPNISPAILDILNTLDFLPEGHSHSHLEAGHDAMCDPSEAHAHAAGDETVDPRAMYFAAFSILVKEYLYRITKKVAHQQSSNVLLANAYHHRSDAFGSVVALGAIGGSYLGYPLLDPLGGLVVSGVILKNGWDVGIDAVKQLLDQTTDATLTPKIVQAVEKIRLSSLPPLPEVPHLAPSKSSSHHHHHHGEHHEHEHEAPHTHEALDVQQHPIYKIENVKTLLSGPNVFVQLDAHVPANLAVAALNSIETDLATSLNHTLKGKSLKGLAVSFKSVDPKKSL